MAGNARKPLAAAADGHALVGAAGGNDIKMEFEANRDVGTLENINISVNQGDSGATSAEQLKLEGTRTVCLAMFKQHDSIMEHLFLPTLRTYFQYEGDPTIAVPVIADAYEGVAQSVNLLLGWLELLGVTDAESANVVETCMEDLIVDNFDPHKVDPLLENFLTTGHSHEKWMAEHMSQLQDHPRWRQMICRLAAKYPDSTFLRFVVVAILASLPADEDDLLINIPTELAVYQLEIFLNLFKRRMKKALVSGGEPQNFVQFIDLCCVSEHTCILSLLILHSLVDSAPGGINLMRIIEVLGEKAASHDIFQYELRLQASKMLPPASSTASFTASTTAAVRAMTNMMSKRSVNQADINTLYIQYSSQTPEPPPVCILRHKFFIELLLDRIFLHAGEQQQQQNLSSDMYKKYFYLLSYAAAVYETYAPVDAVGAAPGSSVGGARSSRRQSTQFDQLIVQHGRKRLTVEKDELKSTQDAVDAAYKICSARKNPNELLLDLPLLCKYLRYPIVAYGLLKWIGKTLAGGSEDDVLFPINQQVAAPYLLLIDEIASAHQALRLEVHRVLMHLLQHEYSTLDVLVVLELRKLFVERLIHLMSTGYVLPVMHDVKQMWQSKTLDVSLIRYFVLELLDMIKPPISKDFAALFQPMVADENVISKVINANTSAATDAEKEHAAKVTCAQQFLIYCRKTFQIGV